MTEPSYLGIFPRHTSQFYSLGPVLNQDRTPFKPTGAMFTLYNELRKTIINGRDHIDVIGRWQTTGIFTFEMLPEDMELVNPNAKYEVRRGLLEWYYGATNERRGLHEFRFRIVNVEKISLAVIP